MAETNTTLEIIKLSVASAVPLIAAFVAYKLGVKSKHKDRDIQKENEINNVISNLLIVWHYLTRLDGMAKLKFDDNIKLPISKDFISTIFIKSGVLNDDSFIELDNSIVNLKKYDPISYYELEGIGKKYEFLKKNYVIPLLKSKSNNAMANKISAKYLDEVIKDVEEFLEVLSGRISLELQADISKKLERDIEKEKQEIRSDILLEFYDIIITIEPYKDLSFDDFLKDVESPESQAEINKAFTLIMDVDISLLLSTIMESPNLSIEEIMKLLPNQNTNIN